MDPISRWDLTAIGAVLAATKADGSAWDAAGEKLGGPLPDPLAQLEVPLDSFVGRTRTVTDSLAPTWNESLVSGDGPVQARDLLPGAKPWLLWIGDEDSNSFADVMCRIDSVTAAELSAGGFTRTNVGRCLAVAIKLTCRP